MSLGSFVNHTFAGIYFATNRENSWERYLKKMNSLREGSHPSDSPGVLDALNNSTETKLRTENNQEKVVKTHSIIVETKKLKTETNKKRKVNFACLQVCETLIFWLPKQCSKHHKRCNGERPCARCKHFGYECGDNQRRHKLQRSEYCYLCEILTLFR